MGDRMPAPVIHWFRQDLRLGDNPALTAATASGRPVVCLYVLDDETPGRWAMGGASRWWLHHSLVALDRALRERGNHLVLRRGRADAVLRELAAATGSDQLFLNRCYEPFAVQRDRAVMAECAARGIAVHAFNAALLCEPGTVATQAGGSYKVFTAFWRACRSQAGDADILPAPRTIPLAGDIKSDRLEDWALLPRKPDWAQEFPAAWTPGEAGAQAALARLVDEILGGYSSERDRPASERTSRLSPHLHFGEIGPRQVRRAVLDAAAREPALSADAEKFLSELGWREFSYHLLHHMPALPERCLRDEFAAFPWHDDEAALNAWRRGQTGVPIVDAGMRQLWRTGWMHNRVRMIAASFLVKHLLVPWQRGAAWFWDTLVDADLANNSASWQWVAGCGADAVPFFRIFNPVLQGERFDPDGSYVRQWVPELTALPDGFIHRPWEAPVAVLAKAAVTLGRTYPAPAVELKGGRERALAAYAAMRRAA